MKTLSRLTLLSIILALELNGNPLLCFSGKGRPIAATKPSNGSLFILTAEGGVYAINLTATSESLVGHFALPSFGYPSDMTYGKVKSQPALFVAISSPTQTAFKGKIQAFSTDGHPIKSWTSRNSISGLGYDVANSVIYFTSADSSEVYSISTVDGSGPTVLCEVRGSRRLGSLSVDSARQLLYVADFDGGAVYMIDLKTKHANLLSGALGKPQALLLSSDGSQLLIADSAKKQVSTILLPVVATTPRILAKDSSFRSPSGLAWSDFGQVIVADDQANSVFLLDENGSVIYVLAIPQ
jgi:hypothetical protein